ncbi:MAG TPA: response regulator [Polyangiaceae bacterium]|nr:response regulator [Polyangiaceae bacterium]
MTAERPCDLRGLTILVVEDDEDCRDLLGHCLGLRGAQVLLADCAAAALESLALQTPDVMVSDIAMPGEDGYTLMRRVRSSEHAQSQNILAIALTTYTREHDSLSAGFDLHLSKPLPPTRVAQAVRELAGAKLSRGPHRP